MEVFQKIIEFVDTNIIRCLVPILLTLILLHQLSKGRLETRKMVSILRWIMIAYTIASIILMLCRLVFQPEEYTFLQRATGPYAWSYWLLFASFLFPFSLCNKRLASKFWYVLLVAVLMKIGSYIEQFVLLMTSFHRDYLPEHSNSSFLNTYAYSVGILCLQGILISVLSVAFLEVLKQRKEH